MARRLPVPTAWRFPATTQDRQPIIKRSKKMPKRAWTDTQAECAVLQISFDFLQDRIVLECGPIGRVVNDLWRNKIIPFRDVVAVLIAINTQVRSAIGDSKNHRPGKHNVGVRSVVNRPNEATSSECVAHLLLQSLCSWRLSVYEIISDLPLRTYIAGEE